MAAGTQEKNAGGTDAEPCEAMDGGLFMGGTLAVKSVRNASEVMGELRRAKAAENGPDRA